ncbi:MAG: nuclear transport factor 2 family protein [Stenotrophobium sp.]
MLSLQEISDRIEIQQAMVDYASAIDQKNFDALDRVFTADAYIDYRAMGGIDGPYPKIKAWLSETLQRFPHYYHLVGNVALEIEGDTAHSKIACFNPMQMALPDGKTQVMFFGLWYIDQWVRTGEGWRMRERIEEKCFDFNLPSGLNAGPA